MARQRRNGRTNGRRKNGSVERQLDLTGDEARILLDACKMYRYSLPVYLMSSKPGLLLINKVIRKLS